MFVLHLPAEVSEGTFVRSLPARSTKCTRPQNSSSGAAPGPKTCRRAIGQDRDKNVPTQYNTRYLQGRPNTSNHVSSNSPLRTHQSNIVTARQNTDFKNRFLRGRYAFGILLFSIFCLCGPRYSAVSFLCSARVSFWTDDTIQSTLHPPTHS